jgi:hypothetical protein
MVFLPNAIAYHLHPVSFPKAYRRIEKVGESAAYFRALAGQTAAKTKPAGVAFRLNGIPNRM